MSRIGKQPVTIPAGVEVRCENSFVVVAGPLGKLSQQVVPEVSITVEEGQCMVQRKDEQKRSKQMHGLYRQLLSNMVVGVSVGFEKRLQLVGVGYRAEKKDKSVVFNLGYSMPIEFIVPEGIEISVEGQQDRIIVKGINKQRVGQTAAEIRSLRKPEPYKGKGIKYADEILRRKEGKSGAKK